MIIATIMEIRLGPFFTFVLSIYSDKDEVSKPLKCPKR